ncbi:uncharacterized protein PHALS_14597 [Plasmopara halstedii]|uniref:Uncharacterized protein n=1 Tax=Plasmopara halstedii TaxID=4781 RepID=A0A0P1AN63_PLAHL|nr:uncharacterized protein PHALS_14597 [Plasmopara halstedii]CEG42136.1 hypothetical protein PHALS_14597 [Plasmopara halstedii]|eukprot:XP_024578505.1 hypothetical protein PHALS_14597 [Plasmopara halstedii]
MDTVYFKRKSYGRVPVIAKYAVMKVHHFNSKVRKVQWSSVQRCMRVSGNHVQQLSNVFIPCAAKEIQAPSNVVTISTTSLDGSSHHGTTCLCMLISH